MGLEVGMFLDKASIALGLAVEGLRGLGQGMREYCFRVGCGGQPVFHHPCLLNVIKFGV